MSGETAFLHGLKKSKKVQTSQIFADSLVVSARSRQAEDRRGFATDNK